jgi:hypothetical protein
MKIEIPYLKIAEQNYFCDGKVNRIPAIDEFVNDFRFEVYSEGFSEESVEDFCGWYPYQMGRSNWRDLEELQILIDKEEIRTPL